MSVRLRRYGRGDAAATHEVFVAAVHGTAAAHYEADQIAAWAPRVGRDLAAWDASRSAAWTVVAETAGTIVGFADLTDAGGLDMLFVAPQAGGRGIARALVEAVVAESASRGLRRVTTRASRSARPVLAHLGFTVDREDPHNTIRGVRVPNTRMHVTVHG